MRPLNDTNWITRFNVDITSSSNRVFSNGRQQLQVSVSVTPKEGQTVTNEQLDSIRLVTLDDDGNYQELSGDLQASTQRDERFDYYGGSGTAPQNLLDSNSRRRKFYVSSTRPGGSLDVIYASISKDSQASYVSHTNRFNSSVTVESITPLRMNRNNFEFEGIDEHWEQIGEEKVDFDVYHLSFKSSGLRIVDCITHGAKGGVPYYQDCELISSWGGGIRGDGYSIHHYYYHFAYPVGPERTFSYGGRSIAINKRRGVMDFVRLKLTKDGAPITPVKHDSVWGLLDQHGNEHKIEMTQESSGNIPNFRMYD
nr:hypothetical protein [uncultured Pseudomonas sp.]